jgi:3-oxoacyl-[acyl-carrier protein] reductase
MDLMLDDKVALVCGASQGLGLAIAKGLAAEGAAVALLARNADKLEAEAGAIRQAGGRAMAAPADLGDWDSVAGRWKPCAASSASPTYWSTTPGHRRRST